MTTHKTYVDDCCAAFKIFDVATLKDVIEHAHSELRLKEEAHKAAKVGQILTLAESLGMSGKELAALLNTRNQVKPPSRAKYVHPSNPRMTWTGMGKRPDWVKSWDAQHGNLDALRVQAPDMRHAA